MPRFDYPCPDCRTTSNLHGPDCEFEGASWADIEKAYTDLVAVLSANSLPEEALRNAVTGRWSNLHKSALDRLVHEQRVMEDEQGHLELLTADEYKEHVTDPNVEPIKTVARKGSVPGAHDNAVFAMIAWYEMVGLSWSETRERVVGERVARQHRHDVGVGLLDVGPRRALELAVRAVEVARRPAVWAGVVEPRHDSDCRFGGTKLD